MCDAPEEGLGASHSGTSPSFPVEGKGCPRVWRQAVDAPRWDVFISYSTKDREQVSHVVNDLESLGFRVWQDASTIGFADRIRDKIDEGIHNSSLLLIFISPRSLRSRWVLNELDAAMLREVSQNKPFVLPVLMGAASTGDLPGDLRGKKYLDLRHGFRRKYDAARANLVATIRVASLSDDQPAASVGPEMVVGDELVRFVVGYDFSQAREERPVPREAIAGLIKDFAESYLDELPEIMATDEMKRAFVERYGRHAIEKAIEFSMDQAKISLTRGLIQPELDSAFFAADTMIAMVQTNAQFIEDDSDDWMIAGFRPNGELFYAFRQKPDHARPR
nr:toll/interleukin-1 receptor domain-containing protein [Modestobacter versicolor]